jgi:pullulanase
MNSFGGGAILSSIKISKILLIFTLCIFWSANSAAAFLAGNAPFSFHGARGIFRGSEKVEFYPKGYLNSERALFFAKNLETGESWPLEVISKNPQSIHLRFTQKLEWKTWITNSLALVVLDQYANEIDQTYFQMGELLDSVFSYDQCLGICDSSKKSVKKLKIWAPTAKSLKLFLPEPQCNSRSNQSFARIEGGAWEIELDPKWMGCKYLLQVDVFSPYTGKVESFKVTDPYSFALSMDSKFSVFVDMDDPRWMPKNWKTQSRPELSSRLNTVLYELHIRDFSIGDPSVPENLRGKYGAFALQNSNGVNHLQSLVAAGVTHLHLLPISDFTSVEENPNNRREPEIEKGLPSDSPLPQEILSRYRALDSFNWGYDPFHYFSPEGSYAKNPEGGSRILETREMISSLHQMGFRVVMDVVFNHTFSAGLARESVLDKIVPLYYYRLDNSGQTRNSSCCSDTASERKMMEKLMRDSVDFWRVNYKIDGFRFDLMNLHSLDTMVRIRDSLRSKDPSIVLYGEAWNFGSLLEKDSSAFTQTKAYGQAIGVFNDRIRDAVRGGTTDSSEKSDQGFVTGLFYDFNHEPANRNTPVDLGQQRSKLLWLGDVVRIGMAGNLRDYTFRDHLGNWVKGGDIRFKGSSTGYAKNPEDTVNYVSAHDGYTLWDALQAKLPFYAKLREPNTATIEEKVDRQILAMGIVAFSQGVPFFDSGIEILRSKSGDQNSYDSGDWFNSIDWLKQQNGWGLGLPPSFSNSGDWPFWQPRLADPKMVAGEKDIRRSERAFLEMLKIRSSSPLFRLETGLEIQSKVSFLESELGAMQPPGLIAMQILDEESDGRDLDPNWKKIFVFVNVTNDAQSFGHNNLSNSNLFRIFGESQLKKSQETKIFLPPRSISVWGDR